ncbi:hypothetical protein CVT17_00255 [Campylobacter concisus]|uniref:Uncharacterized protein n=1 Tax=Campylobacter concisus TaxID=199 RepID=A0AAE7NZ01_9BACT|nr:hypothetical protein [Campylobacter concisus]QPH85512.1 hypothetical protein CVT17_00255 [Campylobacter concisus]
MSEQEIWQEYDEFSFLAQAKSSYDYVNNANFTKYSNTEMSKDFYRQAVKALNNPHDVVIEAKFILQNLKNDFGCDGEFIKEICSEILNTEMTPYEYQEVAKMIENYSSIS